MRNFMLAIAFVLTICSAALPSHAQGDCLARVVQTAQSGTLPVKAQPSYLGPDAQPRQVYMVGQTMAVQGAITDTTTGAVWFAVSGGYVQSYSGWATNVQWVLVVTECAPTLPAPDTRYVAIPSISMHESVGFAPIVDQMHQIGDGVVWLEGTAWLDYDWARIVLAGHTPGVFDTLDVVRAGDVIIVWDTTQVEIYTVALRLFVASDDVRWLQPTNEETLTLITCSGARRLIVHAEKLGA